MSIYFGTDGFRGVYGEVLSPSIAYKVGNSLAPLSKNKKILIGRDTRRSGGLLSLSFACGIMSGGVDVIDIGIAPTPVVAFLTKKLNVDFGVMITASHNPKNYNGIKIFDSDGFKISEETEALLERKLLYTNELSSDKVGRYQNKSRLISQYKNKILSSAIPLSGLKIVLDMANGATFSIARELFKKLGAKVIPLNYGKNGKKINYKCGALYPEVMAEAVKSLKADLGFAFDGDGDRIIACDEKGQILDGDNILYLFSSDLPSRSTIVGTSMTNSGLEIALKKKGITLLRSDVGDKYVVEKMKSSGSTLGGEPSGHIINFDYSTTGDGVLTALMISQYVKKLNKPLSKLITFTHFPQIIINVDVIDKYRILNSDLLSSKILALQKQFGSDGRLLLRASGTENKIRIMCEHKNEKNAIIAAKELEILIKNIEKSYKIAKK